MELDEQWIRAHLPEDCRDEQIDVFAGFYLDGLKVMSERERGNPDTVCYEAKDEEDLRWWQLEVICHFVGKTEHKKIWRWYRDHAKDGQWYYIERSHYDFNAIEDARLPGFERFLRNLKYAFPIDQWEERVQYYIRLMNRWYLIDHWDYDREKLCFFEISDSKEYSSDTDRTEEPKPGTVIRVID